MPDSSARSESGTARKDPLERLIVSDEEAARIREARQLAEVPRLEAKVKSLAVLVDEANRRHAYTAERLQGARDSLDQLKDGAYRALLRQTLPVVETIERCVPVRHEGMHPNLTALFDIARSWRNWVEGTEIPEWDDDERVVSRRTRDHV